ncbi:DUF2255 family protein [Streptomyces sp. Ag109_O5-1]|uniref:DUF2255 family protein n=1 Tax=Streptomyces sp. Ag109_O5-1 TaxID=1938851 RepID=UPI0021A33EB6|nr:DUF2255 family protein [Streptomyces sp. Ag109_O5-1]
MVSVAAGRLGIGCMVDSCRWGENCRAGQEQYCLKGHTLIFGSPDPADPGEYGAVDAAYRKKYGRYTSIVEHVLTDRARASTLRLEPH